MEYQTFEEYAKHRKQQEEAGESTKGSSGFLTFDEYARQRRQAELTPQVRKKYYDASGMDALRNDIIIYSGNVVDYLNNRKTKGQPTATENFLEQTQKWQENIYQELDYFQRYADYFTEDELSTFRSELIYYQQALKKYQNALNDGLSWDQERQRQVGLAARSASAASSLNQDSPFAQQQQEDMAEKVEHLIPEYIERKEYYDGLWQNFTAGKAPVAELWKSIEEIPAKLEELYELKEYYKQEEKMQRITPYGVNAETLAQKRGVERTIAQLEQELMQKKEEEQYYWGIAFYEKKNDEGAEGKISKGKELYLVEYGAWESLQRELLEKILKETPVSGNIQVNLAKEEAARQAREAHPAAVSIEHMDQEQQEIFYYLLGAGYTEMAAEYAQQTAIESRSARLQKISDWAGTNAGTMILATLGYGAMLPFAGVDYLASPGAAAKTGLNANQRLLPGAVRDSLAGGVSAGLNEWSGTLPENWSVVGGKGLGDAYQMGLSMGDSYGSAMAFGGYATIFLGLSAASSAYNDAIMRGASVEQAVVMGAASGIAEALFEYVSIDKFLSGKNTGKVIVDALIQGGVEASEEGLTSIANHVSDEIIMGHLSERNQAIEKYMTEDGMSRAEAEERATKDFYNNLAYDILSGAISGGVMGGGQSAAQKLHDNLLKNKTARSVVDGLMRHKNSLAYVQVASQAGVLETDSDATARRKITAWVKGRLQQNATVQSSIGTDVDWFIERAEGRVGDTDIKFFQPETALEDANEVIEAWEQALQNQTDSENALWPIASTAKMAQRAEENLRSALEQGLITQAEYDGAMENMWEIYEEARSILEEYLTKKEELENATENEETEEENEAQEGENDWEEELPDWEEYERQTANERFVKDEYSGLADQSEQYKEWRNIRFEEALESSDEKILAEIEHWKAVRDDTEKDDNARQQAQYYLDAHEMALRIRQGNTAENKITDKEGATDNGRTEILDDSGQRKTGMGTGEQIGELAESTARSKQRSEGKTEAAVLKDLRGNVSPQSAEEIGVKDGGNEKSLYVLRQSDVDQSARWKRIQEDAQKDGARVVFFAGNLSVKNTAKDGSSKVEGIHQTDGNGNAAYYIKVDGLQRNAEMIYRHEKFHEIVSGDADLMATLMEAMEKEYGKQEIARLVSNCVEDYEGIYGIFSENLTEEEERALIYEYMEEIFADAYADIKRGKYSTANARKILKSQTDAVQRAEQNKKATGQKTAPPEQRFSADDQNIRLTEDDLDDYMSVGERMHTRNAKQKLLASGKSPILLSEKEIQEFIGSSIDGRERNNIRAYGKVGKGMAREVRAIDPSINIEGYYLELEANHIEHLSDHIENDSDIRNIPLTPEQAKQIPAYLDSYDDVLKVSRKKDGSIRIVFGKKINGYSVIVETVSKGRKSIHTRTAWQNKTEEYLRKYKKVDGSATSNEASATSGQDTGPSNKMITKNNGIVKQSFSVSEEMNAEYLEAVEQGDMETAQRMVDEAAKKAGYTVHAHHGTPNGTFYEFKEWQYFTESKEYADVYQNQGASSNGFKKTALNPKTYDVFLKVDKLFDTRKRAEREIFEKQFFRQWGNGAPLSDKGLPDWTDGDDLIEFFEENEYDYNAIYLDEGGTGGYGEEVKDRGISIVIKNSSQIKSADPVTYDKDGNVIPLSERFNEEKSDIRYSVAEDVAEMDQQFRQTMAEDDYAAMEQDGDTGLAQYFQEGERLAREKIHEKAEKSTEPQLRVEIKAAQKRIQEQQRVLEQAVESGVTEDVLREKIETNIKNANVTLGIYRAELNKRTKPSSAEAQAKELREVIKEKEQTLRTYNQLRRLLQESKALTPQRAADIQLNTDALKDELREDRKKLKAIQQTLKTEQETEHTKKQEAELKVQKAQQATEELVDQVLSLFSTAKGVKLETRELLYKIADEIVERGYISTESRDKLLRVLYENGEVLAEKDEYFSDIRKFARHSRIYVPDSVRAEFGDDWNAFRQKAWGNQIYLTNNQNDMGIDSTTQELEEMFGGSFSQEDDLKTQLERIIEFSEEGKAERLTLTEMMRRNQNDYGWSVEEQMDDLERKLDEALRRFSEKASIEIRTKQKGLRELMRQREDFRTMRERQADQRAMNALMAQVLKRAQRLKKYYKRTTPSVQRMIDEQIGDLDTLARSISNEGLENLQRILDNYKKTRDELGEEAFVANPEIEAKLERLKQIRLADMDVQDVRELGEALTGIITQIQNYNRMVSAERSEYVSDISNKAQQEVEDTKGRKNDGMLNRYMQSHLDAKRFFRKISGFVDGAWEHLAQMLSDGEELQRQYQMRAMELFNPFLEDKKNAEWLKKAAGKDAKWEKVSAKGAQILRGETVTAIDSLELTSMMKVALLMHTKNVDNLRHIGQWERMGDNYVLTGGGMVIPDQTLYRKGKMREAYDQGNVVRIPPETVRAIAKNCTAQEKAFAALLTKYFDGMAKSAINEVSLAVDGWERATVTNYFPIQSDKAFLVTENELVKQDLSLQGKGFLKERSHKGTNPMYLFDATDVLFRNIDQVARYYGLTRPLRDLHAVLNATYYKTSKAAADLTAENELLRRVKEQEGWGKVSFGSVKDSLQHKWGSSAVGYIEKLSKDLQGASKENNVLSDFLSKLRGNYARAVISFNPSSVLKQMSSYPVALAYLDVGDLSYGLLREHLKNANKAVETLSKYSAVYWYRSQGGTRTEIREYMDRKGFGENLPLGFKWTEKMDSAVTRRLLAACMHHISKSGLLPGSQESVENGTDRYWSEVAKLFNKVVLNTQSNTSIMERPELTRADSGNIARFLTMFRTDAFQQHNMLVEAKGRLKAANEAYKADPSSENKKRLKEAKKLARKTASGIFVGQLMVGSITALLSLALFRDKDYWDEEGEFQWGKFLAEIGTNVVEGYAGFIIGMDYLWSAIEAEIMDEKWYGPEVAPLENLISFVEDAEAFFTAAAKLDWVESKRQFHNLAKSAGMVFGFPVANVEKYLLAAARYIVPEWAAKYENFWDELSKEDIQNRSPRLMEETVSVIMDNRVDKLSDEVKAELARLYRVGGTGAVPYGIPNSVSYTDNGEEMQVILSAKQKEEYRDIWNDIVTGALSELLASDAYAEADDELKTEYVDKLYKYADEIAKHEIVPEKDLAKWVQQSEEAVENGIPLGEYVSFRVDLADITGMDENGESVTGLKLQRCMALLEEMGWSDDQEKEVYLDVLADNAGSVSDKEKKIQKLMAEGMSREEAEIEAGMTEEEEVEALSAAGLSWDQINDIVVIPANKNRERMAAIAEMNIGEKEKVAAMSVYGSFKEKNLLKTGYDYGVKMEWYMEVLQNADGYNDDGKKNGTVDQEEARAYISIMDISYQEKTYLFQMVTDCKEGKKNPFWSSAARLFWLDVHENDPPEENEK